VKAREKAQADFQTQAQAKATEDEKVKLAESQQFKTLAEKLQAQVNETTPRLERLTAYQEAVKELLKERVKELGDAAKTAVDNLPGEPDELAKLQWLTKNAGLFQGTTTGGGVGTPRGPKVDKTKQGKGIPQGTPSAASRF